MTEHLLSYLRRNSSGFKRLTAATTIIWVPVWGFVVYRWAEATSVAAKHECLWPLSPACEALQDSMWWLKSYQQLQSVPFSSFYAREAISGLTPLGFVVPLIVLAMVLFGVFVVAWVADGFSFARK